MERKWKSISFSGVFAISTALVAISAGCGYPDKMPSYLRPVANCPDCFVIETVGSPGPFQPKERVRAIRVVERDSLYTEVKKVCWQVVADEPVLAKGFKVTVGEVPEGFRQVIPEPPEVFAAVPGRRYYIAVSFAHPLARPWVSSRWKPERYGNREERSIR
jgi:hypothetical protein